MGEITIEYLRHLLSIGGIGRHRECAEMLAEERDTLNARCERLEKALREIIDKGMFVQMQDSPKAYADCAMACFWQTIAIAEHALEGKSK